MSFHVRVAVARATHVKKVVLPVGIDDAAVTSEGDLVAEKDVEG
tara:strand:+ start:143 stop:274 length:132 start_codon:yes stop_codon:yes gene_type:complete